MSISAVSSNEAGAPLSSNSQVTQQKNDLPSDILNHIFSYLKSAEDAKNARFVCKNWAAAGLGQMKWLTALGPSGVNLNDALFLNPQTGIPFTFPRLNNRPRFTAEMFAAMVNATKHSSGAVVITFSEDIPWDTVKSLSQEAVAAGISTAELKIMEWDKRNRQCETTLRKNPIKAGTYIYTRNVLEETLGKIVSEKLDYLEKHGFDKEFPHAGVWVTMQLAMRILGIPIAPNWTTSDSLTASGKRIYVGSAPSYVGVQDILASDGYCVLGPRKFL